MTDPDLAGGKTPALPSDPLQTAMAQGAAEGSVCRILHLSDPHFGTERADAVPVSYTHLTLPTKA